MAIIRCYSETCCSYRQYRRYLHYSSLRRKQQKQPKRRWTCFGQHLQTASTCLRSSLSSGGSMTNGTTLSLCQCRVEELAEEMYNFFLGFPTEHAGSFIPSEDDTRTICNNTACAHLPVIWRSMAMQGKSWRDEGHGVSDLPDA